MCILHPWSCVVVIQIFVQVLECFDFGSVANLNLSSLSSDEQDDVSGVILIMRQCCYSISAAVVLRYQ